MRNVYVVVNFGGPRDLSEVEEFLIELLTDQEVIQTPFPPFFHRWLFRRVAKKRGKVIVNDYAKIGGKSPIFEDTEAIASELRGGIGAPVLTFHRYLPKTHVEFISQIELLGSQAEEIRIFPLFPQFSYATTGSIALWFSKHLSSSLLSKLGWIRSYAAHPGYIAAFQQSIHEMFVQYQFSQEETILLFSAHGLPQQYVDRGDSYQAECEVTYQKLAAAFPLALSRLCYQSQFGKKEWLRPYTIDCCKGIEEWGRGYKNVILIPLSFTSDHIETLFEMEEAYLPLLKKRFTAVRCPALNRKQEWIRAIVQMIGEEERVPNQTLIRSARRRF